MTTNAEIQTKLLPFTHALIYNIYHNEHSSHIRQCNESHFVSSVTTVLFSRVHCENKE